MSSHRLDSAGIGEVEALHLDTYADADRFYSFRRATHRGEADYGRQAQPYRSALSFSLDACRAAAA